MASAPAPPDRFVAAPTSTTTTTVTSAFNHRLHAAFNHRPLPNYHWEARPLLLCVASGWTLAPRKEMPEPPLRSASFPLPANSRSRSGHLQRSKTLLGKLRPAAASAPCCSQLAREPSSIGRPWLRSLSPACDSQTLGYGRSLLRSPCSIRLRLDRRNRWPSTSKSSRDCQVAESYTVQSCMLYTGYLVATV